MVEHLPSRVLRHFPDQVDIALTSLISDEAAEELTDCQDAPDNSSVVDVVKRRVPCLRRFGALQYEAAFR
jgi:hypothetical protein